jgi:hypothetical protein
LAKFLSLLLVFMALSPSALARTQLVFDCVRTEKDYVEHYELKVLSATKDTKAKVMLDDRDLDRVSEDGRQSVKGVVISGSNVLIAIEAHFEPETLHGVAYPAGKVSTQITINRSNGKLIKVETIDGGILGAHVGNGTRITEEVCQVR